MLFSDIEGSTLLLSRLGPTYTDALDAQRKVSRIAWAAHGGTEMGTEGDSFFVVFPTAPGAVAAATQAQRELAGYPWPGGERVRVRIGIHTGSPTVHAGGYVGMDVHRAARIAGAAHGGQVVLSDATASLIRGRLPDGVDLRDLGSHRLKDIARPERLYQLDIGGLLEEFPPLRTLGTATSLPIPVTPLVGREGELAELAELLTSPGLRLVTLTGPGGSGKTRLAIGLAQRLTEVFPDGVYFVPLASVTSADLMWATIAEVLDMPPESRMPPAFFSFVEHRSALFVLDNLEQLAGADAVVAQLLIKAPQTAVIVTSRRPLHVGAEHEHPVPPLDLPAHGASLRRVAVSGAVQLFTQQARKVRPSFAVTADNAAELVAVCRRLDGLPLAIELAAARTKLLSPHALLARLDQAIDIKGTEVDRPSRQRTLRDTISWSYDLLAAGDQIVFRRLGVFAGGADLEGIAAVATPADDRIDVLESVGDLVDANLATSMETSDGEPRVGMLETIRAYARDQLSATGELEAIGELHARHFLNVAEEMSPQLRGNQRLEVRIRFETELENFREALLWALSPSDVTSLRAPRRQVGMRLCVALHGFWHASGYFSEGRRWLELAIEGAGDVDQPELAHCHGMLARNLRFFGDLDRAHQHATASVNMWRCLDGEGVGLPQALNILAFIEWERGKPTEARRLYEAAIAHDRKYGHKAQLRVDLGDFAILEGSERNYQRSLELDAEALAIARELDDPFAVLFQQHNMACTLRVTGRVKEASQQLHELVPQILQVDDAAFVMILAEDYAAVHAELGTYKTAAHLLGAADAMHERLGIVRDPMQDEEIAESIALAMTRLSTAEWDDAYEAGRNTTVEEALTKARAAGAPTVKASQTTSADS